jgi:hypothetical protein
MVKVHRRSIALLVFFRLIQLAATAHAGNVAPARSTWITNGSVDAIVTRGSTCYIGGIFSRVGPYTGHGVPVDTAGNPAPGFATVDGPVVAVAGDGQGGWYIGGSFTTAGTQSRQGLAHILADGSLDSGWNPAPVYGNIWGHGDNQITAIAVSGGKVYVAGSFTRIGGQNRTSLAALDATGAATSWDPSEGPLGKPTYMGVINSLAVSPHGRTVYVGGDFSFTAGRQAVYGLVALDATTGTVNTGWSPNPSDEVHALAVSSDGKTVYVGGDFQTIGSNGAALPYLAAVGSNATDGTTHGVANSRWKPNPGRTDYALALSADGSTLYAGGKTTAGSNGTPAAYLASIGINPGDAARFGIADTRWAPKPDGEVRALALSGSRLLVGGRFKTIGGQGRNCIAALSAATGAVTGWDPGAYDAVLALAPGGNTEDSPIYIGGNFIGVGGAVRNNLAAIDSTGQATGWAPNPDAQVFALALGAQANTLYAGGHFQTIGSNAASLPYLAAIGINPSDSKTFGVADPSWTPKPSSDVFAMAPSHDGKTLYVGGNFATIGSNAAWVPYLAAIGINPGAPTTFGIANTSWAPNPDDWVWAIALSPKGRTIYVGGYFSTVGGQKRSHLGALDAASAKATAWNPGVSGGTPPIAVASLAVGGNTVYCGGIFNRAGGQSRNCVAAIDRATGLALPWSGGVSGPGWLAVYTIALNDGTLYVGGYFQGIGGQPRNNLAALDASTGAAKSWDPDADDEVYAVAASGNTVYAGGAFHDLGQYATESFAELPAPPSLWQNATDLGNDWEGLNWFGCFYTGNSPWIYHATLGWLYPFGTSTDSIWFWDVRMNGFWWTSATLYPDIYSEHEGAWLCYAAPAPGQSPTPRMFYNYNTGRWESE